MSFVTAYTRTTGTEVRIPAHWIGNPTLMVNLTTTKPKAKPDTDPKIKPDTDPTSTPKKES